MAESLSPLPAVLVVMALREEAQGVFESANVSVLYTGVGKVNAASALARRLSDYRHARQSMPLVVNFGTAGSRVFDTGSLVECSAFVQRDMDVQALGFQRGVTPFDTCPARLESPRTFEELPQGVCGSGDSFATGATELDCDVVEMEAYALAKVCWQEGARFVSVKFISDGADHAAADAWQANVHKAAEAFLLLYQRLVSLTESVEPAVMHAPDMRLAVSLAWRLEEDIHADGWPVGKVYRSLSELRQRYGVGDESLHEAIRLLEFNGVARTRPGRGGGLVIERPALSLVTAAITGYFRIIHARPDAPASLEKVNLARASLAAVAARAASELIAEQNDAGLIDRMQRLLVPRAADLPLVLANAIEDPCLHLCACCLSSLGHSVVWTERDASDSQALDEVAIRNLVDAIVAGNHAVAEQLASSLTLAKTNAWLDAPGPSDDPFGSLDSPLHRSRVGQLVRRIATDLHTGSFSEQGYLGSEAVLSERYSAARSTLRQALRVLEDANIIAARRGRGHGWFVCAPSRDLPIRQIRNYLAGHRVPHDHASEIAERWRLATHEHERNSVLGLMLQGLQAYANVQPMTTSRRSVFARDN